MDPQQLYREVAMSDEATAGSDLEAHQLEEERRTANGIYGVIVGTGVMAAAHGEAVGRLAIAVLVTLLVYWVAERYAHIMARRIVLGRELTGVERRHELAQGWELVTASFLPLLVLLGTGLFGADLFGSVLGALIFSTGLLAFNGWQVGSEAHLGVVQRMTSAAIAGAFGVVMIVLHTFLH